MRGIDGLGNWILVIMSACSLISMIAVFILDSIVTNDFYLYGLEFSYGWAIPYWNVIGIVFAMGLLNIFTATAFQIYRIRTIRKDKAQDVDRQIENTV